MTRVDVYPVGWMTVFRALRLAYSHHPDVPAEDVDHIRRHARQRVTAEAWRTLGHIRHRRWRSIKNSLNGYLAEPTPFPPMMRRCGSGWTRRRAIRSLYSQGWIQPCEGPYWCPTAQDTECCPTHSGWDRCCLRPDLHRPQE